MKEKRIKKEEYAELFCQEKRIRQRRVIYVSEEVHKKLKDIAFLFRFEEYTTTSSLADAILRHHMKSHKDLLNELDQEQGEKFRKMFSRNNDDDESG